MRWRGLAIDVGVAGLVLGATLGVLASLGFGTPEPGAHPLDGLGVLLALLSTLPLVGRRLAPLAVYLVSVAATTLLIRLGYPLDVPLGPVVAAYTVAVAYGGDPRRGRRVVAMVAVSLFVPLLGVAYGTRGKDVWEITPELLAWMLLMVGVWIAGDRNRLRRVQIEELRERAERIEREAERERRLAAAEERTRIARELHDSAGHAINVILVQAGAARLLYERDPQGSRRSIATIEAVARDTIGEIDRLVHALRDNDDDPAPPPADPAALEDLVARHRANGLAVTAHLHGPRRHLPRSVAWAAYRILQEALTNAARHGRGSADVKVSFWPDAVEITVTNPTTANGSTPGGGGHGIVGMRERATLLGGVLEALPGPDVFRLHAHLPHNAAAVGVEAR